MTSPAPQQLQTALIAASRDASQRAVAVSSLRGAEVWAATWPTDPATLRTLTNSNGVTALPLFTDELQLSDAAMRYAWLGVDGRVPAKRLSMAEAMRFARSHRAQIVILDIAADHALELDEGEMELVSSLPSNRPPPGPGVYSHNSVPPQFGEVRLSSRPPSRDASPSTRPPAQSAHKPTSVRPAPDKPGVVAATFGATPTGSMRAPAPVDPDSVLDALEDVLKEYPEVEWACLVQDGSAVAVRLLPQVRKNADEIRSRLTGAAEACRSPLEVRFLETPEEMKQARQSGKPFYPWRKR